MECRDTECPCAVYALACVSEVGETINCFKGRVENVEELKDPIFCGVLSILQRVIQPLA
jgi:hypothetical protein